MGQIQVDGLGIVDIAGDTPTPEEQQAIISALNTKTTAVKPNDPRAATLNELTGGFVNRTALEAAGGIAGGVIGAGATLPTGPGAVAGGLAGGGLGAAAGSLVFDTAEDLLRFAGILEPRQEPRDAFEPTLRAAQAGVEDVAFAGGFMAAGTAFRAIKPGIGKILGLRSEDATRIVREAEAAGVPVAAVDVATGTRGTAVRGVAHVLGIFPFVGGPFRKAAREKAGVVIERVNETLNSMAPNATLSNQLGLEMTEAARKSIGDFRNTAARLYDNFRELAKTAGDIVPADGIRAAAQEFVDSEQAGKIVLKDQSILEGAVADDLGRFINDLTKLPDSISVPQYSKLMRDLKDFVDQTRASGFDVSRFSTLKEAAEQSLNNIKTAGVPNGKEIADALAKANEFYAKGIVKFQTATGQKFARVDKNIFRPGPVRPGTIDADEIARVAVNLKSPQAIRDLRNLVGEDTMGKAARLHFETAWDDALLLDPGGQIKGIDWAKFAKDVGLIGRKTQQTEALKAFLESTGVSLNDVRALVQTASRIEVPKNVNQFIARRAALGGMGSAIGGATAATMIKDSLMASLIVSMLFRKGAKILADPAELKAMRRALQPDTPVAQQRAFLGRMFDALDDEQVVQPEDEAGNQQPLDGDERQQQ